MTLEYYKTLIKNNLLHSYDGDWVHHWDIKPLRPFLIELQEEVKKDLVADLDMRNIVIILPDNPNYILTKKRIVLSHVCQLVDIYKSLDKAGVRDEKGRRPTNKFYSQYIVRTVIVHDGVMYLEKAAHPIASFRESKVPIANKQIVFAGVIADRERNS